MSRFKKIVEFIFEKEGDFSLEHRLFLSTIIVGILTSLAGAIINLVLVASLTAVIVPFILAFVLLVLYYFLRFKGIFEPFVFPSILVGFIGISIIWISNGGINGSNIMPAFVILILGLIIVPPKQKKFVIAIFIIIFVILYLIQFFHPYLIIYYTSEDSQWYDSLLTLLYSSFFIFLIISFVHENYTLEKLKAKESGEKYRMLTESMKDVVWTIDTVTMHYTYISHSVQKLRGFAPEEIIKMPLEAAFTPEESGRMLGLIKQRVDAFLSQNDDHPIFYTDEVMQPCKDGTNVWTEAIHEYYLNEKNNHLEIRGVTRDISERKKAEQQIVLQNQELQNLNKEKDKFLSIIAHDLKNPFHSIIGLSRILVEKVKDKDHRGIEGYAETIRQSSHRVMDLLTNLMIWSHSQTGRMNFNPEQFKIGKLIEEVNMLFAETIKQKSITIKLAIPQNDMVFADKAMIGTIMRNLLSNAIKFSFQGGEVMVSAIEKVDGLIVIVSDCGVGIPEEYIYKLFRIDENYSTPGTQKEQGTGLGLILCKEFVEKHGGEIWVESKCNQQSKERGSTFSFTIPFNTTH